MNRQLTIYDNVFCSDTNSLSLQDSRSDSKRQAIQRYLNQGKPEPTICVNEYSPGRRKARYYRLSYEWQGKKKHIHIKGGNTETSLATYRAKKLRELIDRGADLEEVLAMAATFNGG
jgi:hypothetical protein